MIPYHKKSFRGSAFDDFLEGPGKMFKTIREIFSDQGMYENAGVRLMVEKNVEKKVRFFEKLIKTIREDFFRPGNV